MDNNAKEQKQKNDWRQKGLGWTPDYPDLRDYDLKDEDVKNKLRFKIEERTGTVEFLAMNLIHALKQSKDHNSLQSRIDEIETKIFGSIFFVKVKVHKLLRDELNDKEDNIKCIQKPINYESILSMQIVELKKYLSVLLMGKYLSPPKQKIFIKDRSVDFNDPAQVVNWIVDWMRDKAYDSVTKEMIEQFQHLTEIKVDGIVGLETYTTFNEYFCDYEKLSQLPKPINEPNKNDKQKALLKIHFFSVGSVISKTVFEKILNILKIKVTEQIYKELTIKNNNNQLDFESISEQEFLKNIGVTSDIFFQNPLKTIWEKSIKHNENLKSDINQFLSLQHKMRPQLSDVIEVLQNSYLIEPILSVVIKSLCPLAKFNSNTFEEVIEKGFDELDKIIFEESNTDGSNEYLGYSPKKLVEQAIYKVINLLQIEINTLIKEEKKKIKTTEEIIPNIFLCFLLKKYLNRFEQCTKAAEYEIANAIGSDKNIPANIFDKQEVFEIEELVNYNNDSTTSSKDKDEKEKIELFPTLHLHIPFVNKSFIKELKVCIHNRLGKPRPYFLLPGVIDLSFWCSPVRDQGSLNSCTAFAAIALLEYFVNRNSSQNIGASPLFLYKAARNKMNVTRDVGASIRETMKVLALFGVPPEESWSYQEDKVDDEPPPYCYAYAQNYKTLKYFLLDYAGISKESLLFQIKAVLAAGFPCIFGFTVYTSAYEDSNEEGHIPFPDQRKDKVIGGHTVVAVGYDDFKFIRCADRQHYCKGAFLIRNSWGSEWGVNGYGWLPYDYVLSGLTAAWWSLLKSEWFDESNFGLAGSGGEDSGKEQGG